MRWRKVRTGEEKYDLLKELGYIKRKTGFMSFESCTITSSDSSMREGTEQPCLQLNTRMTARAAKKYWGIKHFVIGDVKCRDGATDVICVRESHLHNKGPWFFIVTTHKVGCCPCTIYSEYKDDTLYSD